MDSIQAQKAGLLARLSEMQAAAGQLEAELAGHSTELLRLQEQLKQAKASGAVPGGGGASITLTDHVGPPRDQGAAIT